MEKTNILLLLTPKNQLAVLDIKMNLRQALEKMRAHGYSSIPVINKEGEYCGVVSEGDLLWNIYDEEMDEEYLEETRIKDLIQKDKYPAVKVEASLDELANLIIEENFVPVIDDRNILMGIVTRKRVLKTLLDIKV